MTLVEEFCLLKICEFLRQIFVNSMFALEMEFCGFKFFINFLKNLLFNKLKSFLKHTF